MGILNRQLDRRIPSFHAMGAYSSLAPPGLLLSAGYQPNNGKQIQTNTDLTHELLTRLDGNVKAITSICGRGMKH